MMLRLAAIALVLLLAGFLALAPTAQAQDDPYGDGLTRGELGEWFRENSPGETELLTAILGWIDPCKEDGCWLTRGKVFLAMSQVDDDDAGAESSIGKFHSTDTPSGSHVTGETLQGWINEWRAFHRAEHAAALAALPPAALPTPEPTPPPVPTPWWEETTPAPHSVETFEVQPWWCDGNRCYFTPRAAGHVPRYERRLHRVRAVNPGGPDA